MPRTIAELGDLSNRTAVITGGAGHIGRAIAEALLEHGCSLVLADNSRERLDPTVAALSERYSAPISGFAVDLGEETERQDFVSFLRDELGQADILVNNAAFAGDANLPGWAVPFEDQAIDTWRRAIEVNLTAPFHLARDLAPLLRRSGKGSIINIGSIYGMLGPVMELYDGTGMGNPGAYAASKGGLVQLTRWLATTLAPDIRVNCISPGGLERGQSAAFQSRYVARTPLARMGSEEDLKGAALFLASDLSAWVTGQNIMVDGGWSAW